MGYVFDVLLLGSTGLGFYGFGMYFFHRFLFRDFAPTPLAGNLFSSAFSLSAIMFELILFEVSGVLEDKYCSDYISTPDSPCSSRYFAWKIILAVMLALLIVVFPFALLYQLLGAWFYPKRYALL